MTHVGTTIQTVSMTEVPLPQAEWRVEPVLTTFVYYLPIDTPSALPPLTTTGTQPRAVETMTVAAMTMTYVVTEASASSPVTTTLITTFGGILVAFIGAGGTVLATRRRPEPTPAGPPPGPPAPPAASGS